MSTKVTWHFWSVDLLVWRRMREAEVMKVLKVYFVFTCRHYCICVSLVSLATGHMACLWGKLFHLAKRPLQSLFGHRKEGGQLFQEEGGHREVHETGCLSLPMVSCCFGVLTQHLLIAFPPHLSSGQQYPKNNLPVSLGDREWVGWTFSNSRRRENLQSNSFTF